MPRRRIRWRNSGWRARPKHVARAAQVIIRRACEIAVVDRFARVLKRGLDRAGAGKGAAVIECLPAERVETRAPVFIGRGRAIGRQMLIAALMRSAIDAGEVVGL